MNRGAHCTTAAARPATRRYPPASRQARNSKEKEPRFLALEGELAELIERRRKVANGPLVFHHDRKPIVDFRKAWMTVARMPGISGSMPTSSSSARIQARNRPAAGWRSAAGVGAKIPMLLSGPGRTKRESLERLSRPRYHTKNNPVVCSAWPLDLPSRLLDVVSISSTFNTWRPAPQLNTHWFTAHRFGMCVAFSAA